MNTAPRRRRASLDYTPGHHNDVDGERASRNAVVVASPMRHHRSSSVPRQRNPDGGPPTQAPLIPSPAQRRKQTAPVVTRTRSTSRDKYDYGDDPAADDNFNDDTGDTPSHTRPQYAATSTRRLSMPCSTEIKTYKLTASTQHSLDCPGFPKGGYKQGGGAAATQGQGCADELSCSISSTPYGSGDSVAGVHRKKSISRANSGEQKLGVNSTLSSGLTAVSRWSSASGEMRRRFRDGIDEKSVCSASPVKKTVRGGVRPEPVGSSAHKRDITVQPDELPIPERAPARSKPDPSPRTPEQQRERRARRRSSSGGTPSKEQKEKHGITSENNNNKARSRRRSSMTKCGPSDSHKAQAESSCIFTSNILANRAAPTEYEFEDDDYPINFGKGRNSHGGKPPPPPPPPVPVLPSPHINEPSWGDSFTADPFNADPFEDDEEFAINPKIPTISSSSSSSQRKKSLSKSAHDDDNNNACRGRGRTIELAPASPSKRPQHRSRSLQPLTRESRPTAMMKTSGGSFDDSFVHTDDVSMYLKDIVEEPDPLSLWTLNKLPTKKNGMSCSASVGGYGAFSPNKIKSSSASVGGYGASSPHKISSSMSVGGAPPTFASPRRIQSRNMGAPPRTPSGRSVEASASTRSSRSTGSNSSGEGGSAKSPDGGGRNHSSRSHRSTGSGSSSHHSRSGHRRKPSTPGSTDGSHATEPSTASSSSGASSSPNGRNDQSLGDWVKETLTTGMSPRGKRKKSLGRQTNRRGSLNAALSASPYGYGPADSATVSGPSGTSLEAIRKMSRRASADGSTFRKSSDAKSVASSISRLQRRSSMNGGIACGPKFVSTQTLQW